MGNLRKQTILSSIIIYVGFLIGFLNTYLYTREGINSFTTEQYGLTRIINDLGFTFFSFASLGVMSFVYKFHPFYSTNLRQKENDQVAVSTLLVCLGFALVCIASVIFEPLFVQKFSERSQLLVVYYYWILPFTAGILFFTVFEAFAWFVNYSPITNFLKETGLRLLQLVIIVLFINNLISFDTFIKCYSLGFPVIAIALIVILVAQKKISFSFTISRVTKKYKKKIASLLLLTFGSMVITTLAQYVDTIIIAGVSVDGLADVGIFTLAAFIANVLQVPQRSIIAAVIPVLSNSWKSKNYNEIQRIYFRTSINLLLISLFIFCNIWLNIDVLYDLLKINKAYEAGKMVVLLLCIKNIIDAGTGVNSQIIGTSNFWRFEVYTGVFLLAISIPLNYFLVKAYGINGSAVSNLIAFGLYNLVRVLFIYRKFKMQPFNGNTVISVILAIVLYFVCNLAYENSTEWTGVFVRSGLFSILFIAAVFFMKLTPDIHQLYHLGLAKIKKKPEL